MVLKRFTGLGSRLNKRSGQDEETSGNIDTPEANAARGVRLFCESGAANSQGEEVLHLPTIVESAVASPTAAASACNQIRKFLSKENYGRPHVQYNAVMLIRILADNPGQSFTKNMDKGFADTLKQLLRNGRDPSVNQIVRETLDALDRDKAYDTNLNTVFAVWRKEKTLMAHANGGVPPQFGPRTMNAPPWNGAPQGVGGFSSVSSSSNSRSKSLPAPTELVGRIEEARTSAKLLLQLVQSTPLNELLGNELVREFSERCQAAQRSIQGYINCDNPAPDDDTMLTLIETNEQLSLAASKHQRAILQARKMLGGATPSPPIPSNNNNPLPVVPPPSNNTYASPLNTTYASPANSSYAPPPVPPPTNHTYASPANSSYAPPPIPPPRNNEAPLLPPVDVASREQTQEQPTPYAPVPLSLQAAPNRKQTASPASSDYAEDPFADHHSPNYTAPPGPPPPGRRPSDREDQYSNSNYSLDVGNPSGSPTSYHPGYKSTPSYLQRQESSGRNLTMHGGASPPQQMSHMTEEEEYARDYPISTGPRTPEQLRNPRRESDVSPIAERGAVTYRY